MKDKHAPQAHEAYPENAPGPFYVKRDYCITCCLPEAEAPELVGFTDSLPLRESHRYFARQPATPAETDSAIAAVCVCCCGALRYRGKDAGILSRLEQAGYRDQCDELETGNRPPAAERRG